MLKQLIQRLLDSRTTPSEASHSSYPDDGTVTQFSPSATSVSSWTKVVDSTIAPSDGYVIVRGKATGESYVQITAGDNPPHMERSTFAKATLNQYPILNLPIAKGKTFKVFAENTAEITVGLIKSIGGGDQTLKDALLQGGGLCLSHWYSSLRRSSLLAKRNGSEVKVFSQTQIPEQRSLLTTLRLSFIRLQVMDGLHSAETGHRSMSALPESWERVALTLKVISELQLRFGRGIPLVSIARRTISNRLRQNSFPAKEQRSTSLVGGASC